MTNSKFFSFSEACQNQMDDKSTSKNGPLDNCELSKENFKQIQTEIIDEIDEIPQMRLIVPKDAMASQN